MLVFNGNCPAMKANVEAKRRQRRKNNHVEALKCMDEGDHPKPMEKMEQSITVEFFMALSLMKRCREKSMWSHPMKVMPSLVICNRLDFIMTEDSDLIINTNSF